MIGKPLVVVLGATAVGKTGLAISLCEGLGGDIISADSRQIYRHMNIGTAKATAEEQLRARHHLIDVVNPDETLTLAEYQDRVYQAIDVIYESGRVPFLVGGTGQYITAIVEGWSIPRVAPNQALRAELEVYAVEHGVEALHERLMALDEAYALRTHPNNVRRVIRALEVCLETGTTMTEAQKKKPPPYRIYTVGLQMTREDLYKRADLRVDKMMEAGFLDEVRQLLAMGYHRGLPAMSGVGYLEMAGHLAGELSLEDAIQQTKNNTHNFIRRQDIWFRGHDNGIMWHNIEDWGIEKLLSHLQEHLSHWIEKSDT